MQMDVVRLRADDPYSVSSLTMEQIANQPPPLNVFARGWRLVKLALIAWGVISAGAAAGVGAYYWNTFVGPMLVGAQQPGQRPEMPRAPEAPRAPETTIATEPPSNDETASLSERIDPKPVAFASEGGPTADVIFAPAALPPLPLGASLAEARMPRPRPNEPAITGSIRPPPYDPSYRPVHRRIFAGPCSALKRLGVPIRCATRVRYAPPPPPPPAPVVAPAAQAYYPRPYQPPAVAQP